MFVYAVAREMELVVRRRGRAWVYFIVGLGLGLGLGGLR